MYKQINKCEEWINIPSRILNNTGILLLRSRVLLPIPQVWVVDRDFLQRLQKKEKRNTFTVEKPDKHKLKPGGGYGG